MSELIGFIAAFCTTVAFAPQAIKVWKSKSTKDISLGTFALLNIGVVLWLVYGLLITSYPLIIANAVTLLLLLAILVAKIKFG